ncbi:MAG: DUF268 domain-containing protein [Planctomycetaceae bacterium]|nr:DUF268 domain-containing protein [Planctomycetaceae bacterium]
MGTAIERTRAARPPLLRGVWRLGQPLYQPARRVIGEAFRLPAAYLKFARDLRKFRRLGGEAAFADLAPHFFDDASATQSGGGEYFFQDVWALKKLCEFQPIEHQDFGSRLDGFVGQATAVTKVVYWDIRRPPFELPGLEFREGDLTRLPLADGSVESISCLHTAEHVGLGRYGDPIDPCGTERALQELQRILAPAGQLLFSMPVGEPSVSFNAYRRWHPQRPLEVLSELRLQEFSAVDDEGRFRLAVSPQAMLGASAGCGLYLFRKG